MRTVLTSLAAGLLAVSFAASADAATKKKQTSMEASCKAQAAKKYSAIHFMKRRDYVKKCMGTAKA
jgi:predicted secreted protein